jgi:hypothetical protein
MIKMGTRTGSCWRGVTVNPYLGFLCRCYSGPDNLRRSLHLLNYLDSAQFQRNMQRALNRGESYHKLVRAVAYAKGGKLRVRTDQEQCLHPIGIARARRAPAGLPTGRRGRVLPPACVCG